MIDFGRRVNGDTNARWSSPQVLDVEPFHAPGDDERAKSAVVVRLEKEVLAQRVLRIRMEQHGATIINNDETEPADDDRVDQRAHRDRQAGHAELRPEGRESITSLSPVVKDWIGSSTGDTGRPSVPASLPMREVAASVDANQRRHERVDGHLALLPAVLVHEREGPEKLILLQFGAGQVMRGSRAGASEIGDLGDAGSLLAATALSIRSSCVDACLISSSTRSRMSSANCLSCPSSLAWKKSRSKQVECEHGDQAVPSRLQIPTSAASYAPMRRASPMSDSFTNGQLNTASSNRGKKIPRAV